MTTFSSWLRAKATMASFPANVPGWERLDTAGTQNKKHTKRMGQQNLFNQGVAEPDISFSSIHPEQIIWLLEPNEKRMFWILDV